ncbi:MAG TPA: LysE family translocator [Solirubrobacteraceae bacterium]|nr:LysE family translocator [Solirubrobacteraceae bacterium]
MSELVAFLGVAVLVIVTPGPDTAMTIRGTLLGGRRAGVMTAFGVISGQACWTVAASAGITALLVASEPAFVALKLLGAAYLIYLGVQAIVAAVRGTVAHEVEASGPRLSARTAYRQGLVSDLGNPKMAAFFTSLLPQFGTSFWGMLALGLTFCALTGLWLAAYASALSRLQASARVRRTIEAVTGTVLVALGVRLATAGRD